MMKIFQVIIFIVFYLTFFVGCSDNNEEIGDLWDFHKDPGVLTKQKTSSIIYMSDLEIIKKSADYLKSCEKGLIFEETQILYENNEQLKPLCKDKNNKKVYYNGDYLKVCFYPHGKMQKENNILAVYFGYNGKVLGYNEEVIGF